MTVSDSGGYGDPYRSMWFVEMEPLWTPIPEPVRLQIADWNVRHNGRSSPTGLADGNSIQLLRIAAAAQARRIFVLHLTALRAVESRNRRHAGPQTAHVETRRAYFTTLR